MVIAIGVDIVKISRISGVLRRHGDRFLRRILHQSEIAIYTSLPPAKRDQFVAGAWAAKEAVFKTLDPADQADFTFRNWYRHSIGNRPAIAYKPVPPALPISPPKTTLSKEDFLLSISHDNDMLVATVLRQRSLKIDHCDILIVGTGLVDFILAVALSWQGIKVLHIDAKSYYGDSSSTITIDQLKKWCVEVNSIKVQHFSDVQIYASGGKATNGFSSKGYGVDLNPRVMFTYSDSLALLLQSRVYKYLKFQSLSNFHVFENDNFKSKLSNTTKEEIFTDQYMSLTTKHSLMKFLKFILQDNNDPHKKVLLLENTRTPIVDFLAHCFNLPP